MKTTEEKNHLIAEFMGEFNVHEVDGRYTCNNCGHEYSSMMSEEDIPMIHADCMPDIVTLAQYHTSWDWLMPVVAKITRDEELIDNEYRESILDVVGYGHIDDTYSLVIEFIEWYNENSQS